MADQAEQIIRDMEASEWKDHRKKFLAAHRKSEKLATDAMQLLDAAETADQAGKSSLIRACDILVAACKKQVDVEKQILEFMDVSYDTYVEAFKDEDLLWQSEIL